MSSDRTAKASIVSFVLGVDTKKGLILCLPTHQKESTDCTYSNGHREIRALVLGPHTRILATIATLRTDIARPKPWC